MIIAKAGKFSLRTKAYLTEHEYTTHDIEICETNEDESVWTIANFNEHGELSSCGGRLLKAVKDEKDIYNVQTLEIIGSGIVEGDNVISGYKLSPFKEIEVWYGSRDADCELNYFYSRKDAINYVIENNDRHDYEFYPVVNLVQTESYTIIDISGETIGEIGKLKIT